jgi:hypothetical protein
MRRYNLNLQNAVWVSTRDAEEGLGKHSNRHNIQLWFRELQHYGFIVMVSPAHHGVNGHGKAPHWRLTEQWHLGKAPTRDFLAWDGSPFTEKRKRNAPEPPALKNRIRGDHAVATLATTGEPLVPEIAPDGPKAGDHAVAMSEQTGGDHGVAISKLTISSGKPELLSAFDALWLGPPIASNVCHSLACSSVPLSVLLSFHALAISLRGIKSSNQIWPRPRDPIMRRLERRQQRLVKRAPPESPEILSCSG